MSVIVDTNVAVVASRAATGSDAECVAACVRRLEGIMRSGGLLIDESGLILFEYTKALGYSGQPGAGHLFVKWVHSHQAIPEMVRCVGITATANAGWRRFEEFPEVESLQSFDSSDQKFVAVAIASEDSPSILNASDTDWWIHRDALSDVGIRVEFLCPDLMRNARS